MSKNKPIQINISSPCSQSWDEMAINKQGRFCAHCSNTVIDFTTWSDGELYKFFSKNKEHVCGRFFNIQLERNINIPYQPHSRLYRMAAGLGLVLLFSQTPEVQARPRPPLYQQQYITNAEDSSCGEGHIQGLVTDNHEARLGNVRVQVFDKGVLKGSTTTDIYGRYTIRFLDKGTYDIEICHSGFNTFKAIAEVYNSSTDQLSITIIDAVLTTDAKPEHEVEITTYKPQLRWRSLNNCDKPNNIRTMGLIDQAPNQIVDLVALSPGVYQSQYALNFYGTIFDEQNTPLPHSFVELYNENKFIAHTYTDSSGEFKILVSANQSIDGISNPSPKSFKVIVLHAGYKKKSKRIHVNAKSTKIDLRLKPQNRQ